MKKRIDLQSICINKPTGPHRILRVVYFFKKKLHESKYYVHLQSEK